jgi:hypothetical protein
MGVFYHAIAKATKPLAQRCRTLMLTDESNERNAEMLRAMHEAFERTPMRATTLELAWEWFLRAVAVYSLLYGVFYWVRLIGLYDGDQWRFDLMPVHWQVASVALAVLLPFAASGLWMLASWGPVIWFICAAIELTMYVGFPDLFGSRLEIALSLGVVAALYVVFRVAFYWQGRKRPD